MVRNMRSAYDGAFKAEVTLEAIKGERTLVQLYDEFGVHAKQIGLWHNQLISSNNYRPPFPIDVRSEIRNKMS
jgi:transposase-like protein